MLRTALGAHFVALFAIAFCGGEITAVSASTVAPRARVVKALNTVLRDVNFKGAKLEEVAAFLSRKAHVNIVIDPVVYASAGGLGGFSPPARAEQQAATHGLSGASPGPQEAGVTAGGKPGVGEAAGITLHLKNVPLRVVLKYVLRYKNLRYIVEDYAIVIVPVGWVPPEALCTEVFRLKTGSFGGLRPTPRQAGRAL